MPIYEYFCEKCHAKEEILQKFDEAAPEYCPQCNAKGSLKKVVTSSSFHLKGGGWYKDLYASNKPKPSSSEETKKSSSAQTEKKEGKVDKASKKDD